MSKTNIPIPADFPLLLKEIKNRMQQAQTRAMLAVNAELAQLYWQIGGIIAARQQQEGWGAAIIPRLSRELANELPEVKDFSQRNIGRMIAFYREYPNPADFLPQPAAKLSGPQKVPQAAAKLEKAGKVPQLAAQLPDSLLWSIPWFHQIVLILGAGCFVRIFAARFELCRDFRLRYPNLRPKAGSIASESRPR